MTTVSMRRAIGTLCLALAWQYTLMGCAGELQYPDEPTEGLKAGSVRAGSAMLYPVSPDVQIRDQQHDPLRPGDIKPAVFNAVAYVRYSLGLLGEIELLETNDAYRLAIALADKAVESAINPNAIAQLVMTEASEVDVERLNQKLHAHARGDTPVANQSTRKVARGQQRLDQCRSAGYEVIDCCKALAWATMIRGASEAIDAETSARGADYVAITHSHLAATNTSLAPTRLQPFNHAETKAWLTYCGQHVDDAPNNITELKDKYGDFHQDWPSEFHPLSRAKQSGRRIYRRKSAQGLWIAIAESTDEACKVRETEVIIQRPGAATRFLVYDTAGYRIDHAFFPTPRPKVDTVRFAPDVCMSCHYTLDKRTFDVVAPSYEALNLSYFGRDDAPVWRDDTQCGFVNEPLVLHGEQP